MRDGWKGKKSTSRLCRMPCRLRLVREQRDMYEVPARPVPAQWKVPPCLSRGIRAERQTHGVHGQRSAPQQIGQSGPIQWRSAQADGSAICSVSPQCTARWASGASGALAPGPVDPAGSSGVRLARGSSFSTHQLLGIPARRCQRSESAQSRGGNVKVKART